MIARNRHLGMGTSINRSSKPLGVSAHAQIRQLPWRKAWEYLCNLTLASCYLVFAAGMVLDFRLTHRASSLLLTVFETFIVFFSLFRPAPKQTNASLYDWAVALAGTFILLLLRPAPQVHDDVPTLVVQLLGMSISLCALFSLNRSWGLVAANRGVKTAGLYAFVRHPIYAGYFVSFGAYLIQNMTVGNTMIYVVFIILELLRVAAEERVLSRDPAYVDYVRRTRWRVVPFLY
jgi:protein-S-isoprenylcysteine O-methyltransferase Ste14